MKLTGLKYLNLELTRSSYLTIVNEEVNMEFKSDLEQIKKSIEQSEQNSAQGNTSATTDSTQQFNTEYLKAKAVAEVHETAQIAQDPTKALSTKLNLKVAEHIDSSPEVASKISQTADKLVDKGLKTQENKAAAQVILSEDETIEADFKKNKDEYLYHGIDHKIDKEWKRKMLFAINDAWFIIWAIVGCFTIVPVSTFLSRIKALKGIVKGVAVIIGILLLLAILAGITFAILKRCKVIG